MANYSYGVRTICPFYLHEARMSITCEGFIDGTVNMTRFASAEEKKAHQGARCEMYDYAGRCPLAAALMAKYDEQEAPKPQKVKISIERPKRTRVKKADNGQLSWEDI